MEFLASRQDFPPVIAGRFDAGRDDPFHRILESHPRDRSVLVSRTLDTARIGHYTGTEMPGRLGNFALAGHRTTFGAPFNRLPYLRVNDAIVIETPKGWYTYRFRNLTYVKPTQVEVLLDVPEKPEVPAGNSYITMTACSPIGSLAERIVAYGTFEEYTPRTAGPPASLTTPSR